MMEQFRGTIRYLIKKTDEVKFKNFPVDSDNQRIVILPLYTT